MSFTPCTLGKGQDGDPAEFVAKLNMFGHNDMCNMPVLVHCTTIGIAPSLAAAPPTSHAMADQRGNSENIASTIQVRDRLYLCRRHHHLSQPVQKCRLCRKSPHHTPCCHRNQSAASDGPARSTFWRNQHAHWRNDPSTAPQCLSLTTRYHTHPLGNQIKVQSNGTPHIAAAHLFARRADIRPDDDRKRLSKHPHLGRIWRRQDRGKLCHIRELQTSSPPPPAQTPTPGHQLYPHSHPSPTHTHRTSSTRCRR